MPFKKGMPRPPNAGRKKGSPNKVTREIKTFLIDMASDPVVQDAFKAQVAAGDRGSMQAFLGVVAHVIGTPKATVQLDTTPNMSKLLLLALQRDQEREKKPTP